MGYPRWIGENPREILSGGSKVITLPEWQRLYAVRTVVYDDTLTPMYPICGDEKRYTDIDQLKSETMLDCPILDWDHNLKIYTDEIRDN